MVELRVGACPDLVNHRWLMIQLDDAWHVIASAILVE
jgi:hypothetical protein